MKTLFLLSAVTILSLFSFQSYAQVNIEGTYKEYWGTPGKTDIDYNDTFVIKKTDASYTISCINSNMYEFNKIVFDGEQLSFEILNTTGNDTMPYTLNISHDDDWLRGTALSITGVRTPIRWEKVLKGN